MANISQTTLDIDVKPAPQCAPQSKDAETCKKSKSEIFAVTGLMHPKDDLFPKDIHLWGTSGND